MSLVDSFMARVAPQDSGCWEWIGAHSSAGYGQMYVRPRMLYTHRLSYEFFRGPLEDGRVIDHLCANTGCCNPDHLEQVEHRENIQRGRAATKTHCRRGHERSPENLYVRADGSRICRICTLESQRVKRHAGSAS